MRTIKRPRPGSRSVAACALAGAMLLLISCASVPEAPRSALDEARVAVSNAQKADASRYAGADLSEARYLLAQADDAVRAENMVQADRLAQQSRIAAELASARTESAKARAVNDELSKGLEALNDELRRSGEPQ